MKERVNISLFDMCIGFILFNIADKLYKTFECEVSRMKAPKMQVKCSVTNCAYNKDSMCHAENLEVNSMGDNNVETCRGTQCSTFQNQSIM